MSKTLERWQFAPCATPKGWPSFMVTAPNTSVAFENKMWVIGGYENGEVSKALNDVWYSTNGTTWTLATEDAAFAPRFQYTSTVFNERIWIIGGHSIYGQLKDIWFSSAKNAAREWSLYDKAASQQHSERDLP